MFIRQIVLLFICVFGDFYLNYAAALNAEQVYAKVKDSVYTVYGVDFKTQKAIARGSAVAVTTSILATNCHVVLAGNLVFVKQDTQKRSALILYRDEKQDLCLLTVPGLHFSPVSLRDSSDVKIGETVFAIGNPQGTEKTLSQGIISNRHQLDGGIWLQTDANVSFGSSGGGLFDQAGELIGITSKMGGSFGFATPTEWIMQVLNPAAAPAAASAAAPLAKLSVSLYRNNQQCFLVMPGRDQQGGSRGLAIWNPKMPNRLVIFSSAKTVQAALDLLLRSLQEGREHQNHDYVSLSKLTLSGSSLMLRGTSSPRERYPFFVARLTESMSNRLQQASDFYVDFNDPDPDIDQIRIVYSLKGFQEGLAAYKQDLTCGK
jgi:hypothetical protein